MIFCSSWSTETGSEATLKSSEQRAGDVSIEITGVKTYVCKRNRKKRRGKRRKKREKREKREKTGKTKKRGKSQIVSQNFCSLSRFDL